MSQCARPRIQSLSTDWICVSRASFDGHAVLIANESALRHTTAGITLSRAGKHVRTFCPLTTLLQLSSTLSLYSTKSVREILYLNGNPPHFVSSAKSHFVQAGVFTPTHNISPPGRALSPSSAPVVEIWREECAPQSALCSGKRKKKGAR